MSTRLVDRAAGALARRVDRRGFLSRSAVVGSAMVAAPLDYGLKPKSAYAAVCGCSGSRCGCGALCCDGWTEFCCTLNGQNRCPDGTVAGGWWKVDGSQFCGGGPRYYLDCNAQCGGCQCSGVCSGACSGTGCGCAKGDCNNRKTGCVRFRYGNCHQEIACLGPIVCRVVTCVAPWIYDPACSTASRTSEATRNHHRPCLTEPFGTIDTVTDEGGVIRVSGWAIDQAPGGTPTQVRLFVDTGIVGSTWADRPRPDVGAAYPAYAGDHGFEITVAARPGPHLVCAYGADLETGSSKFLGIATVNVAGAAGALDRIDPLGGGVVRLTGWAASGFRPAEPINVRISIGGQAVLEVRADLPRPDVAAATGLGADHGFSVDLGVGPGAHQVCVDAVFHGGTSSPMGCLDVVAT